MGHLYMQQLLDDGNFKHPYQNLHDLKYATDPLARNFNSMFDIASYIRVYNWN